VRIKPRKLPDRPWLFLRGNLFEMSAVNTNLRAHCSWKGIGHGGSI
jgi:hypothetical protein